MELLISTSSSADGKEAKLKVKIKKITSDLKAAKKKSSKERKLLEKAVKDAKDALTKAKAALVRHDYSSGIMQLDDKLIGLKTDLALHHAKLVSKRQ